MRARVRRRGGAARGVQADGEREPPTPAGVRRWSSSHPRPAASRPAPDGFSSNPRNPVIRGHPRWLASREFRGGHDRHRIGGMTPEEFRAAGHQIVDWVADYRATVGTRPVMARTEPGDIRKQLPSHPPFDPEPFTNIVGDLNRIIVPGLSHWQHPEFFGYFPCNGTLASVLVDYVSTGLGVLGLAWQSSPALTELEEVVTDWMRGMLGLSETWSGVIQDTASTSTLIALICARERTTDFGSNRGGLQAEQQPLVVYTSAHSHSSVEKAALLAGFGRTNVRIVAHDDRYAMRPDALADAIAADIAAAGRHARSSPHRAARRRRPWTRSTRSRRSPRNTISGCTWMRRWPAPPWFCPNAAGCGAVSKARLDRRQPAQVAWRGVRLHAVLGTRRRTPDARHVHQPELFAIGGGRPCEEPARLGHSARPPVSRAEALVPDPRTRRHGAAVAVAQGSRQRALARRDDRRGPGMESARAGSSSDGLCASRASRRRGRHTGSTHAGLVRSA